MARQTDDSAHKSNSNGAAVSGDLEAKCMAIVGSERKGLGKARALFGNASLPAIARCLYRIAKSNQKHSRSKRILGLVQLAAEMLAPPSGSSRAKTARKPSMAWNPHDGADKRALQYLIGAIALYASKHADTVKELAHRLLGSSGVSWPELFGSGRSLNRLAARLYAVCITSGEVCAFRKHMDTLCGSDLNSAILFCRIARAMHARSPALAAACSAFFCARLVALIKRDIAAIEACRTLAAFIPQGAAPDGFLPLLETGPDVLKRLFIKRLNRYKAPAVLLPAIKLHFVDSEEAYQYLKNCAATKEYLLAVSLLDLNQLARRQRRALFQSIIDSANTANSELQWHTALATECLALLLKAEPLCAYLEYLEEYPAILSGIYSSIMLTAEHDTTTPWPVHSAAECNSSDKNAHECSYDEGQKENTDTGCVAIEETAGGSDSLCADKSCSSYKERFYESLRKLIEAGEEHVLAALPGLVLILDVAQAGLIANECVAKIKCRNSINYLVALCALVDWVDNPGFLLRIITEELETAQADGPDTAAHAKVGPCWRILHSMCTAHARPPPILYKLAHRTLEAGDEEAVLHMASAIRVCLRRKVEIEAKELLILCSKLLPHLRSSRKDLVEQLTILIGEVAQVIGVHEVLGLCCLHPQSRRLRTNMCRLVARLLAQNEHVVAAFLVADYARDDAGVRRSVLRVLSMLESAECADLYLPIIEHGFLDADVSTRSAALAAAAMLVRRTHAVRHIYHLLNLVWYAVLDKSVGLAFDEFVLAVVRRCGRPLLVRYLAIGLFHPAAHVSERYRKLLHLIVSAV
ncbi:hypothetical protein PAPHI01_0725 [Pancytospora philotis]|nr:hypothetical protein PAPHI01_0725 [Pancytospora philotis]